MLTGPQFVEIGDGSLAVFERPGIEPTILFAHATGFHARCWNQIIIEIPHRRCVAFDMRAHGLSFKAKPPYHWRQFGEDSAALVRKLGLRKAIGAGHSMGGHSLALAAALVPEAFAELILIDPVIMPPSLYTGRHRELHFTRKRRNHWQSPHEMFERFKDRAPFKEWDQAVLRDYCDYGLVPSPDGHGFVLACPPDIEASIYEASTLHDANIYGDIGRIEAPATVIRAPRFMPAAGPMDMTASLTAPELAAHFRHGRDLVVPHSHFIPMEAPKMIAGLVSQAAATPGAASPSR